MRIAFVTCNVLPEPDGDETITVEAFRRRGFEVELVPWDGEHPSLAEFDAAVIRSTWNYYERPLAFLEWVHEAERQTFLMNPSNVIAWNHHKQYLLELNHVGVSVVPTEIVAQGESRTVAEIAAARNWSRVVVKPAISAGSFRTQHFTATQFEEAQDWLLKILDDGDALVQEFMESVDNGGEVSYVWIGGEITHGVVKRPRFADAEETVSDAISVTPEEISKLEPFIGCIPNGCLYARIDVMRGPDGNLLLSELELIEPSLFFKQNPMALDRFIDCLEVLVRVRDGCR